MATINIDVKPGSNGPLYIITGVPAGNTVNIRDFVHPDSSVSGSGTSTGSTTDSEGNRAKVHSQTF